MPQADTKSNGRAAIGARIRGAREDSRLTNEALAREVGTTLRTIYRWQEGKTLPKYEDLARLAVVLRKPVSYFLEGEKAA